ncbi:TIR domain-containing protein [Algoriphagus boseongensis]|uniref:TIR domain-containing protein n=1 Tax=Algoriphagus boseongensis TaxID=1442587 RepID=A0A4R6TD88_9BACT|nr:toll/interleukin-1 receptor domain-containing protein [Algoriphagus boseongensis]TDQ19424.1 TIR domain-containing protein [Algoriphagus boseongensis]
MEKDKIFISHRHSDTQSDCRALKSELQKHFGKENVFLDIENLEPGIKFAEAIEKTLAQSKVVLVVMGPDWQGPKDENGIPRLFQENDWVRREVAASLQSPGTRVIPILLKNISEPKASDLPDDLKPLAELQATEINIKRWDYDVEQLIKFLEKIVPRKPNPIHESGSTSRRVIPPPPPKSWLAKNYLWVLGGVVALFVIIGIAGTEPTTYPIDDEVIGGDYEKDSENGNSGNPNISGNPQQNNPPATNQKSIIHDLSGRWVLQDIEGNQSTLVFTQNGNTFEFLEYNILNNQIGKGSGVIDGNNWTADYYNTMFNIGGKLSMATSNSGSSWEGLVIVPEVASTQISLTRN